MPHILDLEIPQIESIVTTQGFKAYRAKQIIAWIYKKFASSYEDMTDLPKDLRGYLAGHTNFNRLELVTLQEQRSDQSKRYLWGVHGTPVAESVLLRYKYGTTGCLSSQAGCPVGCVFCASGKLGFQRNLTRGEILEEFLGMCRLTNTRLSRIVFMGTGEPFFNYGGVIGAIDMLCREDTYDMSRRKITVSTVGIPGAIRKFASDSNGVRLALSLHSASDEVRNELIPVNRIYPVSEIISATKYFAQATGQRVTFEYMLLDGINDSREDARKLVNLVTGIDCLVNLIPWNAVPGIDFRGSEPGKIADFKSILERNRVKVTVRRRLGGGIKAACGQLRRLTT